jgi:rod shape-determining protein MreD
VRPALAFALALLLAALQAALLRWVGGGAVSLALPLAVVVYLGLHAGNVDGAVGAAAVGYVVDLMAGGPKGLMTFLAVALFLFARLAGAALSVQGKAGFGVLTAVGVFLFGLAALLFQRAVSPAESAPAFRLLGRMLVEALLTGALSPVVLLAMRRVDRLLTREDPGLLGLRDFRP